VFNRDEKSDAQMSGSSGLVKSTGAQAGEIRSGDLLTLLKPIIS
jgi:hypothetical protein